MKNKDNLQEYFKKSYYNKDKNYKSILSEIKKEENMIKKRKIFKIISTAILTLLGTTSIVFASAKIYNEYIKQQSNITSSDYDINIQDLTQSDMIRVESSNIYQTMYYKIITNMQDYNKYKAKIKELLEMTEEAFNENFLVVIVGINYLEKEDRNLTIKTVYADETTTHIILKQNENPDFENYNNVWTAVVDKSQLRDNIEIKKETDYIQNNEFVSLSDLPENYSVEDALKDGCFVEDKNKVLSENVNAIDEFIKKAENGENAFIRIYSKFNDFYSVKDIEYKDKLFTYNVKVSENERIYVYNYKEIMKGYKKDNNLVRYYLTDDKAGYGVDGNWEGESIVAIYQE